MPQQGLSHLLFNGFGKTEPLSFWRFCVCAASEILCTVLIPGALAEFFLI